MMSLCLRSSFSLFRSFNYGSSFSRIFFRSMKRIAGESTSSTALTLFKTPISHVPAIISSETVKSLPVLHSSPSSSVPSPSSSVPSPSVPSSVPPSSLWDYFSVSQPLSSPSHWTHHTNYSKLFDTPEKNIFKVANQISHGMPDTDSVFVGKPFCLYPWYTAYVHAAMAGAIVPYRPQNQVVTYNVVPVPSSSSLALTEDNLLVSPLPVSSPCSSLSSISPSPVVVSHWNQSLNHHQITNLNQASSPLKKGLVMLLSGNSASSSSSSSSSPSSSSGSSPSSGSGSSSSCSLSGGSSSLDMSLISSDNLSSDDIMGTLWKQALAKIFPPREPYIPPVSDAVAPIAPIVTPVSYSTTPQTVNLDPTIASADVKLYGQMVAQSILSFSQNYSDQNAIDFTSLLLRCSNHEELEVVLEQSMTTVPKSIIEVIISGIELSDLPKDQKQMLCASLHETSDFSNGINVKTPIFCNIIANLVNTKLSLELNNFHFFSSTDSFRFLDEMGYPVSKTPEGFGIYNDGKKLYLFIFDYFSHGFTKKVNKYTYESIQAVIKTLAITPCQITESEGVYGHGNTVLLKLSFNEDVQNLPIFVSHPPSTPVTTIIFDNNCTPSSSTLAFETNAEYISGKAGYLKRWLDALLNDQTWEQFNQKEQQSNNDPL